MGMHVDPPPNPPPPLLLLSPLPSWHSGVRVVELQGWRWAGLVKWVRLPSAAEAAEACIFVLQNDGMAWHVMVWYDMVWYGMVWYHMVWYGMVWFVIACFGAPCFGCTTCRSLCLCLGQGFGIFVALLQLMPLTVSL